MTNKNFLTKSRWLVTILLITLGIGQMWGATTTLAGWTFTSSSYPSNKTNFTATTGTMTTSSTFYLNGSGSTWNASKSTYAFTSVTDITITLTLTQAVPAGTVFTLSTATYYNKASNAPMKGFSIKAKEGSGSFGTTGVGTTSWSLSTSSATKTTTYTTQAALASGTAIAFQLTGTGKAGSGQGYMNNITITATTYSVTYNGNSNTGGSVPTDNVKYITGTTVTVKANSGSLVRTNYTFGGWNTNTSGTGTNYTAGSGTFSITSDKTLYAKWEAAAACATEVAIGTASLNGTFNLSSVGVQCASITPGTNCSVAANNYGFIWYEGTGNKEIGGSGVTRVNNTTAYSSGSFSNTLSGTFVAGTTYTFRAFAINGKPSTAYSAAVSFTPYTVTFNMNDHGSAPSQQVVNSGGTASQPSNPSATGYTFGGWYTDNGTFENAVNWSSTISENKTYYAKWTVKSHTLTWNWNGGSTTSTSYTLYPATSGSVNYGTAITKPANGTMSKTGYNFNGWSSSATTMPDADLTITAQWTAKQTTVTLDNQSATTAGETSVTATYGSAVPSIAANLPVKTGYTFGGYFTAINGGGTKYINADGTSAKNWDIEDATKTLYAKWTIKPTYTVTLNAGNGTISAAGWTNTSGSVYTKTQANGDESITLPTPSCNCPGWLFQGWSTTSKTNAASFTPDKADGASFVPAANVTYYAVYRQSTQTGTTYTKITDAGEFTTGDYAIVAYTGAGYYAMGDGVSSSHMTETSAAADSWTNSTANYIWTIIKVGDKVAFYNANVGKFLTIVDGAWVLATDGQKFSYSFNSTTKAWTFTSPSGKQIAYNVYYYVQDEQTKDVYLYKRGYSASGNYYTSPSCSGLSVTGVSNPAGAATIYLTSTAAHEGDKIWATYTMNRGYTFNSWSKSGTGATLSSTSAEFTQLTVGSTDATITANFDALTSYTLNYHDGDGNHTMTVYEGENILSILPEPSESCDDDSPDFVGWSTTEISTKTDDAPTFVSSSAVINSTTAAATYYAVYADAGASGDYTSTFNLQVSSGPGSPWTDSSNGGASWAYSGVTFATTANCGMPNSSTIAVTLPTGSVAKSFTINGTSNSWSTSNISIAVTGSGIDGNITTFNNKGYSYDFTASNNEALVYTFTATNASSKVAYIANIAFEYTIINYSGFITTCCDDPELAFTYTGVATAEELVRQNKARLDAADEVVLTYTTSSAGTITDPTAASVYKIAYGTRTTEGGTAASAQVDAISIDKSAKEITLSIKTTSSGGNTGCGTYRVALSQAAYNSGGDNYCEKTAYGFVDVKIKYEFIDAVNGNTTVIKYNTGSGVLFPTAGELSGGSNCHSETRVLKGWISETKLTSLYGGSTRVLTLDDVKDAANTIVAPGADGKGIYAQGTKWYAVWAYER